MSVSGEISLGILGARFFEGIVHAPNHAPKKLGCQCTSRHGLGKKIRALILRGAAFWTLRHCVGAIFGGSGEIRTHERFNPSPVFKTGAFNHSATLPKCAALYIHHRPPAAARPAFGEIYCPTSPFPSKLRRPARA